MSGETLRGRLVAHPTPGKVWVQVPHRNDIGSDWVEADELPAIAADRATDAGLRERVTNWIWDAQTALSAATTIGQRSCRDGDHLNYGNHDRLVAEAADLRAALDPSGGE